MSAGRKSVSTHTRADGQNQSVNRAGGKFDDKSASAGVSASSPFAAPVTAADWANAYFDELEENAPAQAMLHLIAHAEACGGTGHICVTDGAIDTGEHPVPGMDAELEQLVEGSDNVVIETVRAGDTFTASITVDGGGQGLFGRSTVDPSATVESLAADAEALADRQRALADGFEQMTYLSAMEHLQSLHQDGAYDNELRLFFGDRDKKPALTVASGPFTGVAAHASNEQEEELFRHERWPDAQSVTIRREGDGHRVSVSYRKLGRNVIATALVVPGEPVAWDDEGRGLDPFETASGRD